jgi:hypothetical protein
MEELNVMNVLITDIHSGWLKFTVENHSFYVSYLSDFNDDMNDLLDLPNGDIAIKRIMLDGEGKELYLSAWRVYDELFIVWEEYSNSRILDIMQFQYEEFKTAYEAQFKINEQKYNKHFLMTENDNLIKK